MVEIDDRECKLIEKYALSAMKRSKDPQHDDRHVKRVRNNALKIVSILKLEKKINQNLLKTICLLHDFTYTIRKPSVYTYIFEGHIEKRIMKKVLNRFEISDESKKIIVRAVYHHTHSFPFKKLNKERGLYCKILQDADTLDFFEKIRVKMYIDKHDKGFLKNLRKKLSNKLIEYGKLHLRKFLNFPSLAKSFYVQ